VRTTASAGTRSVDVESELVEEVPGGVLAFVSFADLGGALTGAGGLGLEMLGLDTAEIAQLFAGVLVPHHGAHRHRNIQLLAAPTGAAVA